MSHLAYWAQESNITSTSASFYTQERPCLVMLVKTLGLGANEPKFTQLEALMIDGLKEILNLVEI